MPHSTHMTNREPCLQFADPGSEHGLSVAAVKQLL